MPAVRVESIATATAAPLALAAGTSTSDAGTASLAALIVVLAGLLFGIGTLWVRSLVQRRRSTLD